MSTSTPKFPRTHRVAGRAFPDFFAPALRPLAVGLLLLLATNAFAQAAPRHVGVEDLKANLARITASVSGDWGYYVRIVSHNQEQEVAVNADTLMDTMSVIKIPLLVTAFRDIDAGKLDLRQKITLTTDDKRAGTGVLREFDDGLSLTLHDALTMMIIQSDNTATDMVFRAVGGPQRVTQTMRDLGLNHITATGTAFDWFRALAAVSDPSYAKLTPGELFSRPGPRTPNRAADVQRFEAEGKHPFGLSSARDMGNLLGMIYDNKAASEASCAEMIKILRAQQMRTRIPKYLTVASAHKTGDFPPYIANDVGYIFAGPGSTAIVVFFNAHHRGIYADLEDAVARAAEQVEDYLLYSK